MDDDDRPNVYTDEQVRAQIKSQRATAHTEDNGVSHVRLRAGTHQTGTAGCYGGYSSWRTKPMVEPPGKLTAKGSAFRPATLALTCLVISVAAACASAPSRERRRGCAAS